MATIYDYLMRNERHNPHPTALAKKLKISRTAVDRLKFNDASKLPESAVKVLRTMIPKADYKLFGEEIYLLLEGTDRNNAVETATVADTVIEPVIPVIEKNIMETVEEPSVNTVEEIVVNVPICKPACTEDTDTPYTQDSDAVFYCHFDKTQRDNQTVRREPDLRVSELPTWIECYRCNHKNCNYIALYLLMNEEKLHAPVREEMDIIKKFRKFNISIKCFGPGYDYTGKNKIPHLAKLDMDNICTAELPGIIRMLHDIYPECELVNCKMWFTARPTYDTYPALYQKDLDLAESYI